MGLQLELNGKDFTLPTSIREVKLKMFIELLEEVEQEIPNHWNSMLTAKDKAARQKVMLKIDDLYYATKVVPYMAAYVAKHLGCETSLIIGDGTEENPSMAKADLEALYWRTYNMYQLHKPEHIESSFFYDGKAWYSSKDKPKLSVNLEEWRLPEKHMEKSTVIEFMEASQYQANNRELQNGSMIALPKVMAIIFKPKGEKYDPEDEKLFGRREKLFMDQMTLDVALQCAFFLLRLSESYATDSAIYTVARQLAPYKPALISS